MMILAVLPPAEKSQLENIHFICCSNETSAIEMLGPVVQDLSRLETQGIVVYDTLLGQGVLVVAPILCALCDNPRSAEMLNHQGSTDCRFCQMCLVSMTLVPLWPLHTISGLYYTHANNNNNYAYIIQTDQPQHKEVQRNKEQALYQISVIQPQRTEQRGKSWERNLDFMREPILSLNSPACSGSLQVCFHKTKICS